MCNGESAGLQCPSSPPTSRPNTVGQQLKEISEPGGSVYINSGKSYSVEKAHTNFKSCPQKLQTTRRDHLVYNWVVRMVFATTEADEMPQTYNKRKCSERKRWGQPSISLGRVPPRTVSPEKQQYPSLHGPKQSVWTGL